MVGAPLLVVLTGDGDAFLMDIDEFGAAAPDEVGDQNADNEAGAASEKEVENNEGGIAEYAGGGFYRLGVESH